ncbi:hypothetical protein [Candidatus Uabimicrobium amorphum]|uniref:hypothetical protein n=1 Tax=Uabimicrobium amorphum TaxID=2596890 RepID=UPI0034BCF27D
MLSDEYILEQAISRKWITQEQIDLCSIEKSKDQSILDVLVAKDFLSKEQVDKLTWEELDDDDCFLSSDLKLKVMSVDDLDADMAKEGKSQNDPIEEMEAADPLFNESSNEIKADDALLVGEGSALAAHAVIGEDSSFEEPVFGESSTFVKSATFAEEVLQSKDRIDAVDQEMRKSSAPDEEILEFDNDFLESNFENPAFRAPDPDIAEVEASKELDALRSDSAEFTISGNVVLPDLTDKTFKKPSSPLKKPSKKASPAKISPAKSSPAKSSPAKSSPAKSSSQGSSGRSDKVHKIKSQYSKPSQGKSMSTPFGKAAILLKMATEEQVNDALLSQVTDCKGKKIGKIMAEKGYLTNEQIKTILGRQKTSTMICPVCEKRYQIVLFQAGRSYRCKSSKCAKKPELLELRKYLKKRKKSIDISEVPKDVEVMGLTGEISLKKKKPKQDPMEASQEELITNTPDLLKEVGIKSDEVVANIEIEESKSSSGFFVFFMILVVLGGSGYIAHEMGLLNKFIDKYLKEYFPKSESVSQKIESEYKAILSTNFRISDEKEVAQRIANFQNFQKQYPQNPYKKEIEQELQTLQQILTKFSSVSAFESLETKINADILKEKFNRALSTLRNFKDENPSYSPEKISELTKLIKQKSKEKLVIVLNNFDELVAKKQYEAAKNLLLENKAGQLLGNLETINSKLNSVIRLQQQIQWLDKAQQIAKETYPLLRSRRYSKAKSVIDNLAGDSPQLQSWSEDIAKLPTVSTHFAKGLQKLKGKSTTFYFDIKTATKKIKTKITTVDYGKWQVTFGKSKRSLSSLSHGMVSRIIRFASKKHSSYHIALFCSTWKDKLIIKNVETTQKEILALYVFENYKYNIKNRKLNEMLNSLKTINSVKDTQVYSMQKESLASALKNLAKKSKLKSKLYGIIKKYFSDTKVAKEL